MIHKKSIKRYVYEREGGKCFHCGKAIRYEKTTLDHYFPRSLGGTEEFFNLVACCKLCNKLKKSTVPSDWEEVAIRFFVMGLESGKIRFSHELGYDFDELLKIARDVKAVIRNRMNTVFEGNGFRFYVKDNFVYNLIRFHYGESFECDDLRRV